MNHNVWWNGGNALPECGSGVTSIASYPDSASSFGTRNPLVRDAGSLGAPPDLTPLAGSPLIDAGVADPLGPAADAVGKPRGATPAIGALEP